MILDGQGKGRLVPTGRLEPALDVSYKISHVFSENTALRSQPLRKAVVDYITCDPAEHIPLGDFDLLADNKFIRLKHIANDSEWLVLSSNA
jgi:hypothetical protein